MSENFIFIIFGTPKSSAIPNGNTLDIPFPYKASPTVCTKHNAKSYSTSTFGLNVGINNSLYGYKASLNHHTICKLQEYCIETFNSRSKKSITPINAFGVNIF